MRAASFFVFINDFTFSFLKYLFRKTIPCSLSTRIVSVEQKEFFCIVVLDIHWLVPHLDIDKSWTFKVWIQLVNISWSVKISRLWGLLQNSIVKINLVNEVERINVFLSSPESKSTFRAFFQDSISFIQLVHMIIYQHQGQISNVSIKRLIQERQIFIICSTSYY